jgi:hypothetical protein
MFSLFTPYDLTTQKVRKSVKSIVRILLISIKYNPFLTFQVRRK